MRPATDTTRASAQRTRAISRTGRTRQRAVSKTRLLAICAMTALLASILAPALAPSSALAQQGRPPTAVDVATPLSRQVREWDQYTGRFEPVERVEVRARVSGYIKSVNFKDGALVQKGDLLYVIDPRPFEAELAAAKARLAIAQARLKLAEAQLGRSRTLRRRNVSSQAQVDERTAQRDVDAAEVLVAEAAVETAELNLSFTRVTAAVTGRASDTRVDVGNLITGGATGATLLTDVVSLDPIYFVFDVSERAFLKYVRLDKSGARPGSRETPNPVYIQLADENDWPHRGAMNFVDNELGQETGTVRGRALVPNDTGTLTPGLFGTVRLLGSGAYDAVLIPDAAILADQAKKIVMLVNGEDKVEVRTIETGPIIDGLRVVRKGLSTDDRIIVAGVTKVRAGAAVAPNSVEIKAKSDGFNPVLPDNFVAAASE